MTTSRFIQALLVTALLSVSVAEGGVIFDLSTLGGASSATVYQGDTLPLMSGLTAATTADTVGAAVYNLTVPDGWTLVSRDYDTYGWFEDDGTWDNSVPTAGSSALPVSVTAGNPWPDTATETDVRFASVRGELTNLSAPGFHGIEQFELEVPLTAPVGDYTLYFNYLEASDVFAQENFEVTSESFTVTVQEIPEPSTLLLAAAGLLLCLRRPARG